MDCTAAVKIVETYLSQDEYSNYFARPSGLRTTITQELPLKENSKGLDLARGYGYFAIAVARRVGRRSITGIDISEFDGEGTIENIESEGLKEKVGVLKMDPTDLEFRTETFDIAVNFLGLEDIHMMRGRKGVEKTFSEVWRVLKPVGHFCFVAMPRREEEIEAQALELELFSYLCGATWLSTKEYVGLLRKGGVRLLSTRKYFTGRRLTPNQAREEIRFACENVPRLYGIKTPSLETVLQKFGRRIAQHGLGHYSRLVLFVARKGKAISVSPMC